MPYTRTHSQLEGFHAKIYGRGEVVQPESIVAPAGFAPALVARPGDFMLTHGTGLISKLIRLGQRIRYGHDPSTHWSHAAIFVNGEGDIIEAQGNGVQMRNINVYCNTEYCVIHLSPSTMMSDRAQAVAFAHHCLNQEYGHLAIMSVALSLLTGTKLSFGVDGQQICSGLVARSLERIGEIFTENEPWHIMPCELAQHFDVEPVGTGADIGTVPEMNVGLKSRIRAGEKSRTDFAP